MTVQRDQGVGSQTAKQSRVAMVPIEGTSGSRQKGVVGRPSFKLSHSLSFLAHPFQNVLPISQVENEFPVPDRLP
ncbi:uncharacterized protein E5676_scaffold264G001270 [Cucumis melo var. makuwa]|uniref:Uncharacterized protein n=1 Tax=Cucumis melo var. makuwa TaxID=1194695 RepID=A0A5D3BPX0_CUCMM|nr:uncharacterized protein E5676_scaffold264G001270 [Cucumis melo var. makuwa]